MDTHSVADALEDAASFGRWRYQPATGEVELSARAARYLNVDPGTHGHVDTCFVNVVDEDMPPLVRVLRSATRASPPPTVDFRVIQVRDGMRWMRLATLPGPAQAPGWVEGVLLDITPVKHAAIRERLGFELTSFLVGSHSLGEVITSVIQLICKNLGWQWGAYWAPNNSTDGESTQRLSCQFHWHPPEHDMSAFSAESLALQMAPSEGLVGTVWQTGEASWVEDMANDPQFLRRAGANRCKLLSGYVFPVTYTSEDGRVHSPGVLEFYSCLTRQPDAHLPGMSATIGALIAQAAQRLEEQAKILYLAQVDELTTLANRSHFHALLSQACVSARQSGATFDLMFVDLDRFKPINDAFGHEVGNFVLREFARRLRELAPPDAVVGRLGGDEFALFMHRASGAEMHALAQVVLRAARTPFVYEGVELSVSASIGISTFPDNGLSGEELLRNADAAMYRIKQNGRNGVERSLPGTLEQQQAALARRLTIETELRHAVLGNELFLMYQPIVDAVSGRMHAVEALVRWRQPDGTVVPPDVFIPIAEQSHLIVQLGRWVAQQACRDLAQLHAAGLPGLRVHVNMAASEFASDSLPLELLAIAEAARLHPSHVSLELTEGMLMRRPEQVIPVMARLRQAGFEISLDDFGMGHSSLALLRNLPISSIKIDRSFVRDLAQSSQDRAVLQTIVDLGRHMHLAVVAEGVETAEQLAVLRQSECGLVQGYLLGRPMPLQDLIATHARQACAGAN
ncbi:GGDEF domain-containing protein [Hydrogenophaga sp. OTU3427]|uniref:GGDEF domain-containing protein n=1 Tax=Hydrogenophaga sp. OTU3427 TaxID=3043856 RepID=UPI00313F01E5